MTDETVNATTTIRASAEAVFEVLADPARHAAIDGTGWVRGSVDSERLTRPGQVFRVGMYHEKHPDGPREYLRFPPFAPDHLDNSLDHLAVIADRGER